jgi:predicted PurR-regulated permease PerM
VIPRLLHTLGALLLAAVLGVGMTFLLWPLWSWLEAFSGFESMGHSGPATWCFVLTSALIFFALQLARRGRRPPR